MAGMVEQTYAEAVFRLGEEQNCLDTLCNEIFDVADILGNNTDFLKLLSSPTIPLDEKKSVIERVFKGNVSDYTLNFLFVITEKNRSSYIRGIADRLRTLYNDYNGIIEVRVTTSEELSAELSSKLKAKLESVSGKKVTLIPKIDKSILGGIVLDYGNTRMDSSVKTRLEGVRNAVKSIIA